MRVFSSYMVVCVSDILVGYKVKQLFISRTRLMFVNLLLDTKK